MRPSIFLSCVLALLSVCLVLTFAPGAGAQSMNVTINNGYAPSSTFGAGAGQVGTWCKAPSSGKLLPIKLSDLSGALTNVWFTVTVKGYDLFLNDPSTTGDDENLLDGGYNIGPPGASQLQLTGLQNGTYDVYTYGWTPTHPTYTTSIGVQGSLDPVQTVGGPFTGVYVLGVTHAKHSLTITNGQLFIDVSTTFSTALINGFQLVQTSANAWSDLGQALPGTVGAPLLVGSGDLTPNSTVGVSLTNGLPNGSVILVVGGSALNAPLFGGIIVPFPHVILPPLPLGPTGSLMLPATTPPASPSGLSMYVQGWIMDPGGPQGWAATNAIKATTP